MPDIFTPEKRSWVMSRIRGTNTKIDLRMNEMLDNTRYKYEMYPKMFGNPDFILSRKRIVIFCDGDFWHGKEWERRKAKLKNGTNPKYWVQKIGTNMARDQRRNAELESMGWTVLRYWESDIMAEPASLAREVARVIAAKTGD